MVPAILLLISVFLAVFDPHHIVIGIFTNCLISKELIALMRGFFVTEILRNPLSHLWKFVLKRKF